MMIEYCIMTQRLKFVRVNILLSYLLDSYVTHAKAKFNLCNTFSSESFVKNVALQLFRTSNSFGFLYVTALLQGT